MAEFDKQLELYNEPANKFSSIGSPAMNFFEVNPNQLTDGQEAVDFQTVSVKLRRKGNHERNTGHSARGYSAELIR